MKCPRSHSLGWTGDPAAKDPTPTQPHHLARRRRRPAPACSPLRSPSPALRYGIRNSGIREIQMQEHRMENADTSCTCAYMHSTFFPSRHNLIQLKALYSSTEKRHLNPTDHLANPRQKLMSRTTKVRGVVDEHTSNGSSTVVKFKRE